MWEITGIDGGIIIPDKHYDNITSAFCISRDIIIPFHIYKSIRSSASAPYLKVTAQKSWLHMSESRSHPKQAITKRASPDNHASMQAACGFVPHHRMVIVVHSLYIPGLILSSSTPLRKWTESNDPYRNTTKQEVITETTQWGTDIFQDPNDTNYRYILWCDTNTRFVTIPQPLPKNLPTLSNTNHSPPLSHTLSHPFPLSCYPPRSPSRHWLFSAYVLCKIPPLDYVLIIVTTPPIS